MTWDDLVQKYIQLTSREKTLVLITGLIVISLVSFSLFIEVQYKAWQQQLNVGQATKNNISKVQTEIRGVELELSKEANASLKKQIATLKSKEQEINNNLLNKKLALVSKSQMSLTLKSLLKENNQVKLVSFQSIAPQPILLGGREVNYKDQDQDKEQLAPLLYKHSIVVKITGRYFSILEFLQEIEQTNDSILWQAVSYAVTDYPMAGATIEVFTLSTDKEFISVTH